MEEENPTWRVSILRSNNLDLLLRRSTNGWRPLVSVSVDPHLGHNHCAIHETILGSDGQNPNSKTGLEIENPHHRTKLLFEVIHFPQASKKKARRLNRTVLGSCLYEMGELVKMAKEQEHNPKRTIALNLSASGAGSQTKRVRARSNSTSSEKNPYKTRSASPSLHIKLVPPKGTPLMLESSSPSLPACEEEEEYSDSDAQSSSGSVSSRTHNNEGTTLPPTLQPPSAESGLRKRRRVTGYACNSGDEAEEQWISESESDSERGEEPLLQDIIDVDNEDSEEEQTSTWTPWPWVDHVTPILGILGMAVPNPGILPSYRDSAYEGIKVTENELKIEEDWEWEWEWWEQVLCLFTVYKDLRIAEYEEFKAVNSSVNGSSSSVLASAEMSLVRLDRIYQRLQVEWTYVAGLLIGLAAIDAAIFAISPSSSDTPSDAELSSSLFPVDSYARSAVSMSTIATALGLLCVTHFLMYYGWGNVETFVNRARPKSSSKSFSQAPSQSWGYFALSARIPALCMLISILFIVAFLLIVASDAAPPAAFWFLGVLVGMGMWMQYVVRLGRACGRCVRFAFLGVGSGIRSVGGGITSLFRGKGDNEAGQDVPAVEENTDEGRRNKPVTKPAPAKIRA